MSRHRVPDLGTVTRRVSEAQKRRTRKRGSTESPQRTRTGPSWRRRNQKRPRSPMTVSLPVPTTTFDFCSLTDFYCRTRPIIDRGTDPGARHRRKCAPFLPFGSASSGISPVLIPMNRNASRSRLRLSKRATMRTSLEISPSPLNTTPAPSPCRPNQNPFSTAIVPRAM
jgi:hypothetical protein